MSNKQEKGKETRQHIKDQFVKLYMKKKNLSKISISSLVKECNVSRGTFYFYFEDITQLYRECVEDNIVLFQEKGLGDMALSTLRKDYKKHIQVHADFLQKFVDNRELLAAFLGGAEKNYFYDRMFQSVMKHYRKIMEYGSGRELDQVDSYITQFYASGYMELISSWILDGCNESTEMIATILTNVMFKGTFADRLEK